MVEEYQNKVLANIKQTSKSTNTNDICWKVSYSQHNVQKRPSK